MFVLQDILLKIHAAMGGGRRPGARGGGGMGLPAREPTRFPQDRRSKRRDISAGLLESGGVKSASTQPLSDSHALGAGTRSEVVCAAGVDLPAWLQGSSIFQICPTTGANPGSLPTAVRREFVPSPSGQSAPPSR